MKKFYDTNYEEQETILNIDYVNSELSLYTSRKAVYNRIQSKLGEPTKAYYTNKQVSAGKWIIPFDNKKCITSILSRPTLIGNMK